MDETSHEISQKDSDVSIDYDGKGSHNINDDGEQKSQHRKNSSEVFNSEEVQESISINTNGIDTEQDIKNLQEEHDSDVELKITDVNIKETSQSHAENAQAEDISKESEDECENEISSQTSVNEQSKDADNNILQDFKESREKEENLSAKIITSEAPKENEETEKQTDLVYLEQAGKDNEKNCTSKKEFEGRSIESESKNIFKENEKLVGSIESEIHNINEENYETANLGETDLQCTSSCKDPIMDTDVLESCSKEDIAEKCTDQIMLDDESREGRLEEKEADKEQDVLASLETESGGVPGCEVMNSNEYVQEGSNTQTPVTFESVESLGENDEKDQLMDVDVDPVGNPSSAIDVLNCDLGENEIENENNENQEQKDRDLESKLHTEDKGMDVDRTAISLEDAKNSDRGQEKGKSDKFEEEKELIAIAEHETLEQPGGSAEETITGDTNSQPPAELTEGIGKDAEVCIIPDDVTPRIAISSCKDQSKSKGSSTKTEEREKKIIEVAKLEIEKPRRSFSAKSSSPSVGKGRPTRNAAKVAGSKIKSLVQNDLVSEEPSAEPEASESEPPTRMCAQCQRVKVCKFQVIHGGRVQHICADNCYNLFLKSVQGQEVEGNVSGGGLGRACSQCRLKLTPDDKTLSWETMDFCNEECLGKYQTELGAHCANCRGNVAATSLGKYCVRFGYDVKQFCTSSCLEEYKKGLKVCSYCQKDISSGSEGFLAPVGDKGQFKDFCSQSCMEKYEQMSSNAPRPDVIAECAVCHNSKPVRVEVQLEGITQKLCSEPCFAAFKFVNNITEGQCDMCKKYFDKVKTTTFLIYYDDTPHSFCCKTCMNVYILANRKIVPCNWCKVKKYNFDMIRKVSMTGQVFMMCSLNCLMLYQVSVNAVTARRIKCDYCLNSSQAQYHLTMSNATIRNFCSYNCVMTFQNQYPKQPLAVVPGSDSMPIPIPTGGPKRVLPRRTQVETPCVPVISSVQSLAPTNGPVTPSPTRVPVSAKEVSIVPQVGSVTQPITIQAPVATLPPPPPQVYQQIVTKPPPAKQVKNKSILCKPYMHTKGVSCRPHPCMKETQTEEVLDRKCLIPIPVPIFVPTPMMMYSAPFPVAVPFPLPVPVPIFIPTTRNSAKGIFKEIKKIQEKIPTDPFEAELLMMAEMVAGDKKQEPTDSESDEGNEADDGGDGTFSPENVDTSNTFGDDVLQMALKMASELEEPAVDMESVLTSNTITPSSQPPVDPNKGLYASDPDDSDQVPVMSMNRGRKRSMRGARNSSGSSQSKRGRRTSSSVDVPMLPPPEPVPPPRIEVEKPDANMCLKYTFGVNAWRHWVMQKNAELEKAALTNRKIKLFKPELLQLTADELNFSLCLFVKEVRKPNGTEYAPDTIYYLCLGIQQYLFENGRIDNIFTDSYYEKFTDCLDEVAKKFAALYNDSQYIVTRVEEEHLWESKQLGAHSPHVLLSTLMFFNTKHFNLVTVEEHMQLSFSHIMKHWKRNPNAPGVAKVPGSRNVLLRFYPPQSALEANSRKKKVYEQQENEDNPLRCPVKLYEFYLSKCPESVKTRNDVFYLLPERSCVPDSPVWYSTMALGKEPLMKMLHRVKMVKEINIALLTC